MKRYGILNNITSPADLKGLSYDTLGVLCAALREFIVDSVSQTGGHLASNLGIVELAVALEREFDSSRDRIIYDVGHQCYVHKILTGRRDRFSTLRQYGGLSGFMKPEESITDPCITGHASDSVSVALGMAHARTLRNQKYHVVAVIGDGALTGGMAYEALSNAGTSGEPLLVVLNDNNMSIAKNVGGLSRHLSRLRVSPRYLGAKVRIKEKLARIPGGRALTQSISRTKARIKGFLLPTSLFEQMGFTYLGPVDGHDLKSVCELLAQAKKMKKPVLLHVMTQKGRGYAPSENNPEKYHGVSQFDRVTGEFLAKKKEDFSARFGAELCGLADKDARICAITAAMPSDSPRCTGTASLMSASRRSMRSLWRPVWRRRDLSRSSRSIQRFYSAPTTRSCTMSRSKDCMSCSASTARALSARTARPTTACSILRFCARSRALPFSARRASRSCAR